MSTQLISKDYTTTAQNENIEDKPDHSYNPRHYWPPWAKSYYGETLEGLHREIQDFVEWVSPTEEEKKMREDVISRIKSVVFELWPNATVEIIGSTLTDLCVPTSDVDLVIFGAGNLANDVTDLQPLFLLASLLEQRKISNQVKVLSTAKVPIVKFRDHKSGSAVDIAFETNTGPENSKVVQAFINEFPLLKPLTLVVKYYLKQRFLNETWSGGIGSYTLVIMIIGYLQRVQKSNGLERKNLADLLIGFFEFYGRKFNYLEQVISVTEGGNIYDKKSRQWFNENRPDLLSVEDPHNPDVDVGSASFKIEEAKQAFDEAYESLTRALEKHQQSYLSQVVYVSHYVQKFRDRIKQIYGEDSDFSNSQKWNGRKNFASQRHFPTKNSRKYRYESESQTSHWNNKKANRKRPMRYAKLDCGNDSEFPTLGEKNKEGRENKEILAENTSEKIEEENPKHFRFSVKKSNSTQRNRNGTSKNGQSVSNKGKPVRAWNQVVKKEHKPAIPRVAKQT